MRRIVVLTLFALLAANASAQRRGGFARAPGRTAFRGYRGYAVGNGYGYGVGYGYGYAGLPPDDSSAYPYATPELYAPAPALYLPPPQPAPSLEPPPVPVHPQVIDLKPPVLPTSAAGEPQTFAIVLKNGATLDATTVVAMNDSLHYVDPDERYMQVSMREVDRAATRRLNRQRNLTLYLPSPTP